MSSHHLTHADTLRYGPTTSATGKKGVQFHPITRMVIPSPVSVDGDGLANELVFPEGESTAQINDGTLDVPRNVTITSSGDDSGVEYLVDGRDEYGALMTERLQGKNADKTFGRKAFARVYSVAVVEGAPAGPIDVGWGRTFGLPYYVGESHVLATKSGNVDDDGDVQPGHRGDKSPLSGDARGTFAPAQAPDGDASFVVWAYVEPTLIYGEGQA